MKVALQTHQPEASSHVLVRPALDDAPPEKDPSVAVVSPDAPVDVGSEIELSVEEVVSIV